MSHYQYSRTACAFGSMLSSLCELHKAAILLMLYLDEDIFCGVVRPCCSPQPLGRGRCAVCRNFSNDLQIDEHFKVALRPGPAVDEKAVIICSTFVPRYANCFALALCYTAKRFGCMPQLFDGVPVQVRKLIRNR